MKSVTVYLSSSTALAPEYFAAARQAGTAIASAGWTLVYGGNAVGLMQAVADAARAAGGKVIGITPKLMVDKGIHDRQADQLITTNNMRDRKALLEQHGDAFLTLPGGLGTFEEIFEIIVGKQLGYHAKPIVLLNTLGYFNPLLAMIDHGIQQKFIKSVAHQLYHVAETVEDAMTYFKSYHPPKLADKWFGSPSASETD